MPAADLGHSTDEQRDCDQRRELGEIRRRAARGCANEACDDETGQDTNHQAGTVSEPRRSENNGEEAEEYYSGSHGSTRRLEVDDEVSQRGHDGEGYKRGQIAERRVGNALAYSLQQSSDGAHLSRFPSGSK